ncbi:MAG: hypothetical protein JSW55_16235 [Chloroflexota bacterium]|nr:MAG: hypothetical protein JSW55_16235 [Chloroflexota bacterium]
MKLKRRLSIVIVGLCVCGMVVTGLGIAAAQEGGGEALTIRLRRNFGYGLGAQMQGRFTISVSGPDELERVEFLLDRQVIGEDSQAPFSLQFNTGEYSEGLHRLSAVGYTAGGQELLSNAITRQFVSTSVVTIGVVALVLIVVTFRVGSYFLARRSSKGRTASGSYGFLGGALCPNCGRPFGLHWWSLRLGIGRYDRCPHCGKWNVQRRASLGELAAAEEVLGGGITAQDDFDEAQKEEEALRRRIEDSRFEESRNGKSRHEESSYDEG